jgi:hypothetical protein
MTSSELSRPDRQAAKTLITDLMTADRQAAEYWVRMMLLIMRACEGRVKAYQVGEEPMGQVIAEMGALRTVFDKAREALLEAHKRAPMVR